MDELDPKVKASIVSAVLDSDQLHDDCEICSLQEISGIKHYQAVVTSKFDPKVATIFSLPTTSHNVYITVTDGIPATIRRVLATIEETERESPIVVGNVLLLDAPELKDRGVVGVLFLPANVSNVLQHLPSSIDVNGARYRFLLLVFLRNDEHEVWKQRGHDALMDLLSSRSRDLVSFG